MRRVDVAAVWLASVFGGVGCCVLSGCQGQAPATQAAVETVQPAQAPMEASEQRRGPRAQEDAAPGAFDFYLLTLSWSPEYCVSHAGAAECAAHPAFVLHGLWPQNFAGTYPENCSNAAGPANPGQYKDIFPDAGLLKHEWQTHGTCSGLGPDAYFGDARKAFHSVAVPPALAGVKSTLSLTPGVIVGEFVAANPGFSAGSFAVSCGNNRLTAVEVCLGKDFKAISCQGVKTCKANVVKVTPPGATGD
jgi:ribonuclease T2